MQQQIQTVSTIQLAKILKLSERRVQQLTKEGIIPKLDRNNYNLVESVNFYIDYLK